MKWRSNVFNLLLYNKFSKVSNSFLFLFLVKMLVIRAGINKLLVRIANREDTDIHLGPHFLCRHFTGLEKYLNMKGFLEKSLKMKYALKSTGESI